MAKYLDYSGLQDLWAKIKAIVPTKVSDLTNDSGFVSSSGVTSVRVQATSPVASSTSTAQTSTLNTTISLSDAYGDTKNPYSAKTANHVLAGPSSGDAATPTFRALTADDIPTLTKSKISDFPTTWALENITDADDLKAIEALSGTSGLLKKTAANTWTLDTSSYVTSSGVTSVRVQATSPVVSSVNTAQSSSLNTTISLADAYGDTKNPYGNKNANLVLASPSSGNAAAPSFRSLVAADIPSITKSKISDFPTIPAITLNGAATTSPSFYAPTSVGTDGYVLKSGGSGAPSWVAQSTLSVGSATTATKFDSARTIALTGDVTGSASSDGEDGWSIATTLANSGVTAGSYGLSSDASPAFGGTFSVPYITVDAKGRITAASNKTITVPSYSQGTGITISSGTIGLTNNTISVAGNNVALGGSIDAATLRSSLGLSSALRYIGKATNDITDGGTEDPGISGYTTKATGDVVVDSNSSMEYVWDGTAWERLGSETSFKTIQTAKSSPSASGTTTSFIDTISQDANGVITATKKTVTTATTSTAGITTLDSTTANTLINQLSTGSSTPTDNDYYVSQYVGGGTTTTTYHRRPMSALWTYIKSKINDTGTATANAYTISITGNAATATKATQDGSGNTITSTYVKKAGDTMTGSLSIKPESGEGGQINLNASTANTTQAGISIDQYNSTFRIFGIASEDGTTKTGSGTPLVIDPYAKTITGGYTITGTLSGNASSATEFSSNATVTLTGDVTGTSSGSKKSWSVATTLANSGVTADSYGPSADATPSHGGTFSVPYITVDAKGRVTAASTKTITLPTDNNSYVTQTITTTDAGYKILFSGTADSTTRTEGARKSTELQYNPSTKVLTSVNINSTNITSGSATITELSVGDLVATGSASFTNGITGNLTGNVVGTATYATKVKDSNNSNDTTFAYSKSGLSTASWFAAWNNYELRAISPANVLSTIGALPLAGGTLTGAVTGTTFSGSSFSASSYMTVNSGNSGTAGGLALYGTSPTTYGIAMRQTSNGGKHGAVQGDWAIYSYMTGADNRGWIFKNATASSGVASISNKGHATFDGSVTTPLINSDTIDVTDLNAGELVVTGAGRFTNGIYGDLTGDVTGNASTATTASKATAANLTTTANAVAYYTNTTGTFGSKASANGALYATSANGALSWGTLPIGQGGTGLTSSPSMLTNLESTTAANVMAASPRPGVTGTLAVGNGGTGKSSWTQYGLVYASATTTLAQVSAGTSGQVLTSGGSAAPSWTNQSSLSVGTASKLGSSNVGAADRPIYLSSGTATQTTYRMAGTNATATTALAITDNLNTGIWYVNGTNSTDLYSQADGAAFVNKYSDNWISEIYQDYRTGQIALRGKNNGTWQPWRKVLDSGNYQNFNTYGELNAGNLTVTGSARFTNGVIGDLEGNASSASKLSILASKTYTGLLGTSSNDAANDSFYFMSLRPTDYYTQWKFKYRIIATIPDQTNYCTTSNVTYYGYGQASAPAYKIFNTIYSTSYRPIYYNNFYRLTSAGYNAGYGNAIGVGLRNSNARNTSGYGRTITIEVLECVNCTFTFLDTPVKWANWTGTGATNYAGLSEFDAYNNGLRETGDDNDISTQRSYYTHLTSGANGIKTYSIVMEDSTGKWQSFTTTSGTGTSKTRNTTGFKLGRMYYASRNSDLAANSTLGDNQLTERANLIDFRYSTNCGTTLTANQPVWIVGTIGSDGLFYLDSTWWTQTATTGNGKIYIPVGIAYDTYRVDFMGWQGVYIYNGTTLMPYYCGDLQGRLTTSYIDFPRVENTATWASIQFENSLILSCTHMSDGGSSIVIGYNGVGINNLQTPTSNYGAANKKYVDDTVEDCVTSLRLALDGSTIQLKLGNTVVSSINLPVYNGGVS